MTERELREKIAQHLYDAVFPGADWNEPDEYEKEPFYERADQILALFKEAGYKSPEEIELAMQRIDLLQAGGK